MFRKVAGAVLVTLLLAPLTYAQQNQPSVEELFRRFIDARNRHDVAALRAVLAPNVTIRRHIEVTTGPDTMLARLPYEAGINQHIEARNPVVEGDRIKYEQIERSDLSDAFELKPVTRYLEISFAGGLIAKIDHWKDEERDPVRLQRFNSFDAWLASAHPDVAADLAAGQTGEALTEGTGRKVVELAKKWWASQKR